MANVSIDADKLISEAATLKDIAKEFNTMIDDMYQKFSSLDANGAWSSSPNGSLEKFINKANRSKATTLALGNSLNSLGDKIENFAKNINAASDNKI